MKSALFPYLPAVLLLLFSGCASAEEPSETPAPPVYSADTILSIPDPPPETEIPELSDEISEEPPLMLRFREIAEYTAFADSSGFP